jgi:nicotinamide-nucleotide amidase
VISAETAQAMAGAIRTRFGTGVGIDITGAAGPEPCDGAPVGRVYVAVERGGAGWCASTTSRMRSSTR